MKQQKNLKKVRLTMTFNEFIENNIDFSGFVLSNYGQQILDFFKFRFGNLELLYDVLPFKNLLNATLIELHVTLINFKKALQTESIDGSTKTTSTQYADNNATTTTNNSYAGYNVEGDFTKQEIANVANTNANTSSTTNNDLDTLIKMSSVDFATFTNKIYDKMIVLFRTIY